MLFNSIQYLVFLPLVVCAYWVLPRKARLPVLLIASYYFYMSWLKAYGLLLGGLTAVNYVVGLAICRLRGTRWQRAALVAGLAANLGCLVLYKYTDFLITSAWQLWRTAAQWLHLSGPTGGLSPALDVILPLGISFFVFEFIHYLVDVYRGSEPVKSPLRFALFAAFFPSQIAGPIKRYQDFDAQLEVLPAFSAGMCERGAWLVLKGMFKKVALGDNLAMIVQSGFEPAASLGAVDAWLAAIAFAMQIYFDFSGYTDIGRGSAMLLGFSLPENFNLPYVARSLRDFWHRWHISLSTWLRDYLYIPLGGSRGTEVATARNLAVTMLLGGLWHGASWHFVVWGGYHGLGLAVDRWWGRTADGIRWLCHLRRSLLWMMCSWLLTMLVVLVGWVLFRADSVGQALAMVSIMFSGKPSPHPAESLLVQLLQSTLIVSLPLYAVGFSTHLALRKVKAGAGEPGIRLRRLSFWLRPPMSARAIVFLGLALAIIGFASMKSMPFIYFQF